MREMKRKESKLKRNLTSFGKVLLPLLLSLSLIGCGIRNESAKEKQEAYSTDLFAMDTYMTFTAYGDHAETALADVKDKITELESLWSVTDESSEIYKLNHSGGQQVAVSQDTAEMIEFALDMAEKTDGALEPTIYPVLTAWGFTTGEYHVPTEEELAQLLKSVGYDRVKTDSDHIALEEGMMLDLGAVGKGYAGDLAVEILREQGITSALLDIGGNIQTIGSKPDGSNWRIGIRSPFGEGSLGVLEICDMAVVTSGSYERYFVGEDGKHYGHIIDPATGYPVDNGLMSVTVIAKEGKLCDALSTSLFVMGMDKAVDYWRAQSKEFEMILVTEDKKIYITEGIQKQFVLNNAYRTMEVHTIGYEKDS